MKKSVVIVFTILLCLVFYNGCGNQAAQQISEKRSMDFAQLYESENHLFSLNGYSPETIRTELLTTAGYLQCEPVVFHGMSARVRYEFNQDRLYAVTYEFSFKNMTVDQRKKSVAELYSNLCRNFDWLPTYKLGNPGAGQSFSSLWFAKGNDRMSMLRFSANPMGLLGDIGKSTAPSITISVIADTTAAPLATAAYRAHFKPTRDEMVKVTDWIPSIFVDLMYAGSDNFTGQKIYDFSSAYLRFGTVEKLIKIQKILNQQGYSIKICDAFRPVSAQFKLWEAVPDDTFVANPYTGFSKHSKGNTVDITLVTIDGDPVEMPTPVDTFSALADRDYSDVSETAARNAMILQNAMVDGGFYYSPYEWWHYYDAITYPVEKDFIPTD